ncbi:hypothetical protein AVEN_138471-1 [Araneus ventricosus]|uniref:Uncharacterized protein n=1 Tax=Araneus ventricosus TaxID=182803 RepID=A0A4Y2CDE6_ARAVE|nr:hypothetical protein AVEN_138471-1 [Araneus ventricosus]
MDLVILNSGQMTRMTSELASPSPNLSTTPAGWHLTPTDLMCTSPTYTMVLRWNLDPSGPEVETLPLLPRSPGGYSNSGVALGAHLRWWVVPLYWGEL